METNGQMTITIYMEANPNPNSLKFVVNKMLFEEGKNYDFPDKASAKDAPLALELFDFDFVQRVFYMNNFVTVTKKEDIDWIEIQNDIKEKIRSFVQSGQPLLTKEPEVLPVEEVPQDSDTVSKIKTVLEEYIKPAVEMDGGAIQFDSFDEGVLKVNLQGSCSGCPSSTVTLKAGIETLLKKMVPEVNEVLAEGI
jgi:Fe-S cluster biogenesis protein NfuA